MTYESYLTPSLMRSAKKKKKRKKDPKYVHEKYKEILKGQKEKDEGKAKAVAWSIYCKYKEPNSPRCTKDPSDYFPNRKAYANNLERTKARNTAKLVGATFDQLVSKAILYVYKYVKKKASSKYVDDLAIYMWTRWELPPYFLKHGKEAKVIGEIANLIHREEELRTPTKKEREEALRILHGAFEYIYNKWSSVALAKLFMVSEDLDFTVLRLELLSYDNRIKYAYQYDKLLSLLFCE